MLSDSIKNWQNYELGPVWNELMLWINQKINSSLSNGKYTVAGCNINIFPMTSRMEGSCLYESHRTMCDLHMVLQGKEYFWSRPINNLEPEGLFNIDKDIGFYRPTTNTDGVSRITLTIGIWVLVFPWEAHLPDMSIDEHSITLKKLVAKIPFTHLTISAKKVTHGYF